VLYIGGLSRGIAIVDPHRFVVVRTVAGPDNPTCLAHSPDGRYLYAAHFLDPALVSAYEVGGDDLRPLGARPCGGADPVHLSVSADGRWILVANWGSGSFATLPVERDGGVGPVADVVSHPQRYAHWIGADPSGEWILAAHMGVGSIFTYRLDPSTGRLREHAEARLHRPGGVRTLAFHPDGRTCYVVNELEPTLTVCAFDVTTGRLERVTTVPTLDDGTAPGHSSAIVVDRAGKFVHVGHRGPDRIATLSTGPPPHLVSLTDSGGEFPRDMLLSADGRRMWIANERGESLTELLVDPRDGRLSTSGRVLSTSAPTSLLTIRSPVGNRS
jgi:6-phosphogluconolactonase